MHHSFFFGKLSAFVSFVSLGEDIYTVDIKEGKGIRIFGIEK
jgi:hypothetical protein